ncbi:MAG: radical SAM protein, partial [Candidatus Hydrothermarchaeota archaeon]|nr:radical SAM protein [Candidatus Hydrothermarchaeota archaeon]
MIEMAKAFCSVGIVTNGMTLTEETSRRLIELGLDFITVSMAGAAKETHERIRIGSDFDKICENVRTLSNLKGASKTKKP